MIYPQSIDKHLDDGRKGEKFHDHDNKIDDVIFVRKIIEAVKVEYNVDENRIYATGISNGGIFSQRLAIDMYAQFAAVASVAAQIAKPLSTSKPKSPISILLMNGTKDPFVHYNGGEVTPYLFPRLAKIRNAPKRGKVISTNDTIAFWLRRNEIYSEGKAGSFPI